MGGGYHQGKMHTDVNSSMVVSEFADVALHVKPIRGQNDEARTKIKEGFARNYPETFTTNNSHAISKNLDAISGFISVNSNLRLP